MGVTAERKLPTYEEAKKMTENQSVLIETAAAWFSRQRTAAGRYPVEKFRLYAAGRMSREEFINAIRRWQGVPYDGN